MSSRRRCRDRLHLMLSRTGLSALLIAIFLPPAALAQDAATPIFLHNTLAIDSSGCLETLISPNLVFVVIDCEGNTISQGNGVSWAGNRLCLIGSSSKCDSILVVTRLEHKFAFNPYSLRPYITTTQLSSVPEPRVDTASGVAATATNLKVAGSKSFYADVSDQGRTTLAQGLTMTVTGDLGHDVSVRGSFSDRGLRDNRLVTRRFSELENIYLEVESPRLRSVFGNFVQKQTQFSLIRFQRSVQGLKLAYRLPSSQTELSVAVPLGNYGQHEFVTTDGFYGPYRLPGRNGEQGIAVVENSDALWLNGDKLARGRDQDYYLDYLRGELYFTGRRVIDADDRVRVEYEFQRLEYRKTLITANSRLSTADSGKTAAVGYNGFLTARNDPLDFTLSEDEIATLQRAGDNSDSTMISGARFVGTGLGDYTATTDTTGELIYSFVGDSLGDYSVSFAEFATGDYTYLGSGWYQYVGKGKGRFLPLKQLPMPETVHLASMAGGAQLLPGLHVSAESVLSNFDRNRFSSKDDGDNTTVAGLVGFRYKPAAGRIEVDATAEVIPDGFPQVARLDAIEDQYLWQRDAASSGGRKRVLGGLTIEPSDNFTTRVSTGFSDEQGAVTARRMNLESEIKQVQRSQFRMKVNLASSEERGDSRTLVDVRPELQSDLLPVRIVVRGEYDQRSLDNDSTNRTDSKREIESTISYGGVSLGGRLRENWFEKESEWSLVDNKRSVVAAISRFLSGANKIDANANINRFSQGGRREDYQTGSLSLLWPSLIPGTALTANYRLNRRGFSQTNQTYLKVDPGEGDYVLIDSVYVAQSRGDYILVAEQVGDVTQNIDAEKRIQAEFELAKWSLNGLTRGTSFRYEVSLREIGKPENDFATRWLLPPSRYFDDETRISQRLFDYRLRRYESRVGLRSEVSYTTRRDENRLEITAPIKRNSDEVRLSFSKNLAERDNLQVAFVNREREIAEYRRLELNLREKRIELTASHFSGAWEWMVASSIAREHSDSLDLLSYSVRVSPGVNYSLPAKGRIEFAPFVLKVSEYANRSLFLQMAEGFPIGTHWGGRIKVEIGISDTFSFKVIGQAEFREHDENRYFLRSELTSRFQ